MRMRWQIVAIILFCLGVPCTPLAAQESAPPAKVLKAQLPLPWDQPPPEFKEAQREGFHAGVKAAINDFDHHRSPEYQRRREYRHPHLSRSLQADYRKGFQRGYEDAYRHLMRSNGQHS